MTRKPRISLLRIAGLTSLVAGVLWLETFGDFRQEIVAVPGRHPLPEFSLPVLNDGLFQGDTTIVRGVRRVRRITSQSRGRRPRGDGDAPCRGTSARCGSGSVARLEVLGILPKALPDGAVDEIREASCRREARLDFLVIQGGAHVLRSISPEPGLSAVMLHSHDPDRVSPHLVYERVGKRMQADSPGVLRSGRAKRRKPADEDDGPLEIFDEL